MLLCHADGVAGVGNTLGLCWHWQLLLLVDELDTHTAKALILQEFCALDQSVVEGTRGEWS